ncbi:MAG: carbonic anhydrase family protein [Magnetovibrio sp.]|nr:carbonic anhydrase family protein [Magnetovibrio sp.]
MNINLLSCAAVVVVAGSVVTQPAQTASWGYGGDEGPAKWGDLSPDFKVCGSGKMQSPVDLSDANATSGVEVSLDYRPVGLEILNNGHTVQMNVENGSFMRSHNKTFYLRQVHFHTPSEHPISGKTYDMEAHFVHQVSGGGPLAVIGVFFNEGVENAALKEVITHAPKGNSHGAKVVKGVTVDLRAILPNKRSYYRYMGSLTTPPCSEGVNWFVVKQAMTVSKAQIAKMKAAFGGENARPVQASNNRLILGTVK